MGLAGRAGWGGGPSERPPCPPHTSLCPWHPTAPRGHSGASLRHGGGKKEHLRFSIGRDMEPPQSNSWHHCPPLHHPPPPCKHLIQDVKHLVPVGLEMLLCIILRLVRGKWGSGALWVWAPHIPAPQEGGTGQPGGARRAVQCRYRILPEGGGLELI